MRGRGVSAANRSSNSIGSNRSAVVPSLHSVFSFRREAFRRSRDYV
jgi:hypothetical protein